MNNVNQDIEVMSISKPLQQSDCWKKFQEKLNKQVIYSNSDNYSYLGIISDTLLEKYIYFPYGPYVKNGYGLNVYDELIELSTNNKFMFIRVEPQDEFSSRFVKLCKRVKDINPADTLIIDISRPFEEIIADFSASTRRHYRAIKKLILKLFNRKM